MNLFRVWPKHQRKHEAEVARCEALIAELELKLSDTARERDKYAKRLDVMRLVAKHAIDALNAIHNESSAQS